MARGVFTSCIPNADLAVAGTANTTEINIGSEYRNVGGNTGRDSAGSVSIQFTTTADMTIIPYVRSCSDVPYVAIDTATFEPLPAGPYGAGDHIVQFPLPVCGWLYFEFAGTGDVSNIRTNVQ